MNTDQTTRKANIGINSIVGLILRWALLGWYVPLLLIVATVALIFGDGWTRDGEKIYLNSNPGMDGVFVLCCVKLRPFFSLN